MNRQYILEMQIPPHTLYVSGFVLTPQLKLPRPEFTRERPEAWKMTEPEALKMRKLNAGVYDLKIAPWNLEEDNWRPDRNRNLSVYRCYSCRRWHIGHN